jgi:pSer/pThr/pTyr-binding forkhead associated (FHA) protein
MLLVGQGSLVTDRLRAMLGSRGISLEIQAALKVLEGGEAGLEVPVSKPRFKIGRRPDCELQLASQLVSGSHSCIHKRADGVFLEDLQSSNGTFLNRERLTEESELNDGDQIRIGSFVFTIQIFAALAAEAGAGERALQAWMVEELSPKRRPASPYGPTDPDIDLDAIPPIATS